MMAIMLRIAPLWPLAGCSIPLSVMGHQDRGGEALSTLSPPCALAEEVGEFFERYGRCPGGFKFCDLTREARRRHPF